MESDEGFFQRGTWKVGVNRVFLVAPPLDPDAPEKLKPVTDDVNQCFLQLVCSAAYS